MTKGQGSYPVSYGHSAGDLTHLVVRLGVPLGEPLVHGRDEAADGGALPHGVVEGVDADDHDALQRVVAAPELAAEFAVDLQRDLLHHRGQLLRVADRLRHDHL